MKSMKSKSAMKSQGTGDYDHTQEQRLQGNEHLEHEQANTTKCI